MKGSVRKRKNNAWSYRVDLGYVDGKRKQIEKGGLKSEKEATKAMQDAAYVNDAFVSVGMCADFALHDKGDGNPHAHILLTLRPLKEDGTWGAKCHKEYNLDENGQRIRSENGAYKSHRVDTTDWNDRGKAEQWRSAWSDYVNRSLEQIGIKERVDHRRRTAYEYREHQRSNQHHRAGK